VPSPWVPPLVRRALVSEKKKQRRPRRRRRLFPPSLLPFSKDVARRLRSSLSLTLFSISPLFELNRRRLKVHYRAPPDIRGSGKERGHGTELQYCPRCGKELKAGKHHVGCFAGRSAPRQAAKRFRLVRRVLFYFKCASASALECRDGLVDHLGRSEGGKSSEAGGRCGRAFSSFFPSSIPSKKEKPSLATSPSHPIGNGILLRAFSSCDASLRH
jgi:hypothetical protein